MKGRVFEIREFCLHDGPGPRTTVFLQGCPLRCTWCHNPEGQEFADGREMSVQEVVAEIRRTEDFLLMSKGGVTFSGGEPLAQSEFIIAIIDALQPTRLNFALETSGFAAPEVYRRVVNSLDIIIQDLKLPTIEKYRQWTKIDAAPIFENLKWLKESGKPFIIRIPTLPGVNDDAATKELFAELLRGAKNLLKVELLPYNRFAGAKYAKLGRVYEPGFDETRIPNLDATVFGTI